MDWVRPDWMADAVCRDTEDEPAGPAVLVFIDAANARRRDVNQSRPRNPLPPIHSIPGLMYATEEADQKIGTDICRACLVRDECLEYALANRIQEGVWGGMTEYDRKRKGRREAERRRQERERAERGEQQLFG